MRSRFWVRQAAGCAVALVLTDCVNPATALAAAVAVSPVAAAEARIWFCRDYEPSVSLNLAAVALNGALAGHVQPESNAFYRDVPAGHYQITVASYGTDVNQAKEIDLAPGQEAFVKILVLSTWASEGNRNSFQRDTFYVSPVPPQIARAEVASHPLTGG